MKKPQYEDSNLQNPARNNGDWPCPPTGEKPAKIHLPFW